MDGRLSITPAVDVCAFSYDEAAKKVAGDDVIERGSIHKLAAVGPGCTTDDCVSFSTKRAMSASLLEELGGVTLR